MDVILTQRKEIFHAEKTEILSVAIKTSPFIQVDDTRARHVGKNGYCTVITNPVFTWFATSQSKSRINFLELLQGKEVCYLINETTIAYVREKGGVNAPFLVNALTAQSSMKFEDETSWGGYLQSVNISSDYQVRVVTEGALLAGLLAQGVPQNLGILSDDAGQFNILEHALCWIHEERHLKEVMP